MKILKYKKENTIFAKIKFIMDSKREFLVEIGLEDSIVFENPDYESAMVGYDVNSGRIIYDYELMIKHLMEKRWDGL